MKRTTWKEHVRLKQRIASLCDGDTRLIIEGELGRKLRGAVEFTIEYITKHYGNKN